MKNYKWLIVFLIFTALLALPAVIVILSGYNHLLVPGFWGIFMFIAALTLLTIIMVKLVQFKNKEMYAQAFLGATTFKLLACLIFVYIFIKESHPGKMIFIADFMYLYLLNTGFEVYSLLSTLRD